MKYLITENRLVDLVDKYLEDSIGKLRKFPLTHMNAREDDFELADDSGETIFTYFVTQTSCKPRRVVRSVDLGL